MKRSKPPQFAVKLNRIIEKIEDVREKKRVLTAAEDAIFAQAHAEAFDAKTIRRVVALARLQREESAASRALFEDYMAALGMTERAPPTGNVVPLRARKGRK